MSFYAILLSGLVLTCEGLERSRGFKWYYFAPTQSTTSHDYTTIMKQGSPILPSQIKLSDKPKDHGTQSRTTIEDLKKLRWPQWTQEPILDNNTTYYMSGNLSNIIHQAQTMQNRNVSNAGILNNRLPSHMLGAENGTITVAHRAIAEGELVSTENWGLPKVFLEAPGQENLVGALRVTAVQTPILQWHVGVYSKAFEPYMQICGGTLVTTKAVISAAHCFWSDLEGALPASQFVIAAGKLYRPWTDDHDVHAQKSEISAVHLPPRFRGGITSFQDDIAVVLLDTALTRSPAVRPLCVIFDEDLEYTHLRAEHQGVVLGWGLTAENGPPAQALQYLYMPYVPVEECIANVEPSFQKYITSDKICAGVTTGKALCRGDSGGGLVFFDQSSKRVPLLYGVASTAPRNENLCNTHARATMTRVLAHRGFLLAYIPDIEEACAKNYIGFTSDTNDEGLEDRIPVTQHCTPQPTKTTLICNCHCNNCSPKP